MNTEPETAADEGKRDARVAEARGRGIYREESDRRAVPSTHVVRGTVPILAVQ
jgi:hypothetical protein